MVDGLPRAPNIALRRTGGTSGALGEVRYALRPFGGSPDALGEVTLALGLFRVFLLGVLRLGEWRRL